MMSKKIWIHSLAVLAIVMVCAEALAGLPTAEQAGIFSGKGTFTVYFNDNAKPVKSKGTISLVVDTDGSYIVSLPEVPGLVGVPIMNGSGSYGSSYSNLVCYMAGGNTTGYATLTYKINGAKKSASIVGGVSAIGVDLSGIFSAKKMVPIAP